MTYPTWRREVVHTPQLDVPIAQDGKVRVAMIIDNPENAPAFGLVWQQVGTTKPEEWSWIGGRIWALFTDQTTVYTRPDGVAISGKFDEILKREGDQMVFGWIDEMNRRLRGFFGLNQSDPDPVGIDTLYAAMRSLSFDAGQVVRR